MKLNLVLLLLLYSSVVNAQKVIESCVLNDELECLIPKSHVYHQNRKVQDKAWSRVAGNRQSKRRAKGKYTLPVVFHIVHEGGLENIPDIQVTQAVEYLNAAFANEGYYDQQAGSDSEIQFCLVKTDPNGNLTTGINRINSSLTNMSLATEDQALKDLSRWDPFNYINIWVVNEIKGSTSSGNGIAGYAYLPSAHGASFDGIVIQAKSTGVNEIDGTVLVHEMGHYLGLYHTFYNGCKNDDCTIDGDQICDTPPDQSTAASPCQQPANTCNTDINSGFTNDVNDHVQNYMDYGARVCYNQFSPLQIERMQFEIENTRFSLLDSRGCLDPCPLQITANFTFPNPILICDSVPVVNHTTNADLYYWYVDGVFYSDEFQPKISVPNIGLHDLELIAYSQDSLCLEVVSFPFTSNCPVESKILSHVTGCVTKIDSIITLQPYHESGYTYEWFVNNRFVSNDMSFTFPYPAGVNEVKLITYSGKCMDSSFTRILVGCIEICGNEIDDDLDGLIDCFDDDCCSDCLDFYYDACAPEECLPVNLSINMKQKWQLNLPDDYQAKTLMCGDLDGDGDVELICRDGSLGTGFIIVSKDGVVENQFPWRQISNILSRFTPAIADVDRDGTGEILFMSSEDELVRMEHDGSISYVSDPLNFYQPLLFSNGFISIADLNFDKKPEVVIEQNILDATTGNLLFVPDTAIENNYTRGRYIIADILPDQICPTCQGQEILSGTRIYAPSYDNKSMEIAVEIPGYIPYSTAIADWDLDGDEDVITIGEKDNNQILTIWEGQSTDIIHEITLNRYCTSGLVVGNFDMDPEPEIVYVESIEPWGIHVSVLLRDNDLSLAWEKTEINLSYNSLGGFDFNADNILEVFYRGSEFLRILNPTTGEVIVEESCSSITGAERALLADFDNDGHTEIATTCESSIVAYEGIHEWPETRPVHNQYYFYNTHINDDLTVPAYYQKGNLLQSSNDLNSSSVHHRKRSNFKNEFSIDTAQIHCENGQSYLVVDFCQYQNLLFDSISVSLYSGNPIVSNTQLDTTFKIFISNKNHTCLLDTFLISNGAAQSDSIYILINDDGSQPLPFNLVNDFPVTNLEECDHSDNYIGLALPEVIKLQDVLRDSILCANSNITLSILDEWNTYLWSNGETDSSANYTMPGTHWVEVTDDCGKKSRDSFFISSIAMVQLNLPDTIKNCAFSVNDIDAGVGFVSYQWSTGSRLQKITAFDPGTYWVDVTDSCGNVFRDTTIVIHEPLPSLNLLDTIQVCSGDTTELSIATFDQIIWQADNQISCTDCANPKVFPSTSQSYFVYVFNDSGCSTADTVFIDIVDQIKVFDTIQTCGDSVLFRGAFYSYGIHTIPVSVLNGCDTIIELQVDTANVIDMTVAEFVCKGESTFFYNQFYVPGQYKIIVSGSQGDCDTLVTLNVFESDFPDYQILIDIDSCSMASSYTISVVSNRNISGNLSGLNFNETGILFNSVLPGSYMLSVQDSFNCFRDSIIDLTPQTQQTFSLPDTIRVIQGDSVLAKLTGDITRIVSSEWAQDNTISCLLCPDLNALPVQSQYYYLNITDSDGCVIQLRTFVEVINPNKIFTPSVYSPNGDRINDTFKLYSNNIKVINKFYLFDRYGARVFHRENVPYSSFSGWDGTFNGKYLGEGDYTYFYEVEMINGEIVFSKGDVLLIR